MMSEFKGMDKEAIRETLSKNPLFKGLDSFYIDDFIPSGEIKVWSKGSQVLCEGDSGEIVYFILSGRAKVTLYGEEGREIVLAVLEQGEMFGEMSIIDDKPRSANVEAVRDLECLVLSRERFLGFLASHHRVYMMFLAHLTARLREATRKIGGLALLDVCGRIAHTLMGMAKDVDETKSAKTDSDEGYVIEIERPTHEELAAMIGSSREVVSRALKKMTQEGYIKIEKHSILLYMND